MGWRGALWQVGLGKGWKEPLGHLHAVFVAALFSCHQFSLLNCESR